ncbi:MAG: binary toxin-like calcium binding domain-containing protein [Candidatus Kariarchaeaceae archaeon]|jgi:hypothetical protein
MNKESIRKIVKWTIFMFCTLCFVIGTGAQSNYVLEIRNVGFEDQQISTDAFPVGSFAYEKTIPLPAQARDMIIDQNGSIYVFYSNSYVIKVYDQSFTEIAAIGVDGVSGSDNSHFGNSQFGGGQEYGGLFLDKDGLLYVSDFYNQRIQIFDTTDGYSYNSTLDTQTWGNPSGVAVDSKGAIYVTFWSDVHIFNKDLTFSGNTLSSSDSHGLAIDSKDNKFIGNGRSDVVMVYNASNHPKADIQRPLPITYERPVVVRTDNLDNIYVVSDGIGLNIVDIYFSNRSYAGTLGKVKDFANTPDDNTRFNDPMDVAVFGGFIYVLDHTYQRIQVFTNPITDQDNDGMYDQWEVDNGFDPTDPNDANLDWDEDDLTNKDEYRYGTNPKNPDTDGDGKLDGEEINNSWNPLDPNDPGQPSTTDLDNDGMNDQWEIDNGFDPTDPNDANLDWDEDGLTNKEEYTQDTNPKNDDSDGDGYTDKEEIDTGSDPNNFNSRPEETSSVTSQPTYSEPSNSTSSDVFNSTSSEIPDVNPLGDLPGYELIPTMLIFCLILGITKYSRKSRK